MQRFGRAARNPIHTGTCILLAEPAYFTEVQEAKSAAAKARAVIKTPQPYVKRSRAQKHSLKTHAEEELEKSMGEFINADRLTLPCRRDVCNKYFQNNLLSELNYIFILIPVTIIFK